VESTQNGSMTFVEAANLVGMHRDVVNWSRNMRWPAHWGGDLGLL